MKRSNLAYSFLKIFLVTLSMLVSPLVLGEVCKFGGKYVWSEEGKNFVDVSGTEEVVELVEVGNFTANIHGMMTGNINGVMTGTSNAVFKLPFNTWVKVTMEYSNGQFTFNNSDCTGEGSWECKATLKRSESPLDPNVVDSLVEGLCEVPISFSFVSSEGGKNVNFIITTPKLVSSGTATRIRPSASRN